jgi:hypothetical protein
VPNDDDRLTWGGKFDAEPTIDGWDKLTKTTTTTALYWSMLPYVSTFTEDETLPYRQNELNLIIDVARMFALNKLEYELTQDLSIQSQIQQAMQQAIGTADEND